MKPVKLALLASVLAATPVAAFAQEVGATIYGNDGQPIGTVVEANEQVVVIDTGKHKTPVPVNTLFDGDSGKSVNATREQVDMMMDQRVAAANAKRDAALVQGTAVVSAGGNPVGKLGSVDLAANSIVLELPQGAQLRLKKDDFAVNPQGQLAVLYSREQIASATSGGNTATTGGGAQ